MTPTDLRDHPLSRRCALLGFGGVGAAAVLAACSSGSSDTAAGAGSSSAPSSSAPASSSSAPSSSAASSAAPSAGGDAIASLSSIPVGGTSEVQVGGENVLLSQPSAGTVEAFSSVCPHQGGEVKPNGAGFLCSLHKSEFDIDGAVTRGPARSDLTKIDVIVSGDSVVKA